MSLRRANALPLMVIVTLVACARGNDADTSNRRHGRLETPSVNSALEPEAGAVNQSEGEPPAAVAERDVDLRINGESLRVVRPSATNPWVVGGSVFDAGPMPLFLAEDGDNGPTFEPGRGDPVDVIRRVPQLLSFTVSDPDGVGDILGYYVEFEGYEGNFFVPVQPDSEVIGAERDDGGRAEIGFFLDEVFPPGTQRDSDWAAHYDRPFTVEMRVIAVDRRNQLSAPMVQELNVLPVGRGDLEVTLSMSEATDLDLYVVEPNRNVIYFDNMRSATNGRLDLDANADCRANRNVRYEHIFWPEGGVPEGTYQIRVDNWRNCIGGGAVDFQVIVQSCGDISMYEGTASGDGGRGNCRNPNIPSCQQIATVDVIQCDGSHAVGGGK